MASPFHDFMMHGAGVPLLWAALAGYIVIICMLSCCFGRTAPLNMFLLAGFTVCMSYMLCAITIGYERNIVMAAGATTALVTCALTLYAMFTKTNI